MRLLKNDGLARKTPVILFADLVYNHTDTKHSKWEQWSDNFLKSVYYIEYIEYIEYGRREFG